MNESFENFLTSLNDDISGQIDWTPMVEGGANYRTFEMVEVSSQRVEYRQSGSDKIVTLLCFVVGVGCCGGGGYLLATAENFSVKGVLLIPLGLFFVVAGFVQMFRNAKTPVFDRERGLFWKGSAPETDQAAEARKDCVSLNQIHAIQIVKESIRSTQTKFSSFEVNLILNDGSRVNVIDHSDRNAIRTESDRLGEFLGVPVWDASDQTMGS